MQNAGALPDNFTWLLPGRLAGMARPVAGLEALARSGVRLVVCLTAETPPDVAAIEAAGMVSWYMPVPDFSPPTIAQARATCARVETVLDRGEAVAYHCRAGKGRTGTMLAAQMIHRGMGADEAVKFIRARNPGWIETQGQLDFLTDFAATIR